MAGQCGFSVLEVFVDLGHELLVFEGLVFELDLEAELV